MRGVDTGVGVDKDDGIDMRGVDTGVGVDKDGGTDTGALTDTGAGDDSC